MKSRVLRTAILAIILASGVMFVSSCNKGYGCPSDFSIGMAIELPSESPSC